MNFNLEKLKYETDHGTSAVYLKKTFLLMDFTQCIAVFICLILYQTICSNNEVMLAGYGREKVCLEAEIHHPWAFKNVIWVGSNFHLPLDVYNIDIHLFRLIL